MKEPSNAEPHGGPNFLSPHAIRAAVAGTWLRRPQPGTSVHGVGIDTRESLQGKLFVGIRGERFDGSRFAADAARSGASLLMLDQAPVGGRDAMPGSAGVLLVADGRTALGDLARAWRRSCSGLTVVGITGSAGKTTTRRLVHGVLAQAFRGSASPKSFNNDIGVPLTILAVHPEDTSLVAELGMSAPGEIRALASIAAPDIAVITMVGRAHLAGMGSVEAIAREKSSLLESLSSSGIAVVNGDQPVLDAAIEHRDLPPFTRIRFGSDGPDLDLRLTGRSSTATGQVIEVNECDRFDLRLPGAHNALNALAAIAVGRARGLTDEVIRKGLATVEPAAMRLERLERGGITFYNDAYNANPDAMAASIRAFVELSADAPRRVLILGDMLELGEASAELHREVGAVAGDLAQRTPIAAVVLVGEGAEHYRRGLLAKGWTGEATLVASLDEAGLSAVQTSLRPGDVALVKGSRGSAMERILLAFEPVSG